LARLSAVYNNMLYTRAYYVCSSYFVRQLKLSSWKQRNKLQWLWHHLASKFSHRSLIPEIKAMHNNPTLTTNNDGTQTFWDNRRELDMVLAGQP